MPVKRFDEGQISRRERQVMDILFRKGKCTAENVMEELPDPPSYSAVRALLSTLEQKELVTHTKDSRRYVYQAAVPEKRAKRTALKQLMATFFDGSPEKLVASLLDPGDQKLSKDEIARIRTLIAERVSK
ncbi:MAG: BlaI/MecI/CopY family transcriptional regulator [Verrucomicrobia bacterium]|jgi:predicted transcriptional regulator|nr:BlaI/MecI/CopY family transcriptional regulator [Verrucomicrobiota bacterium]|tara:strand:+ start:6103 stop:6492 length:390 start_codon:yes stop_codon:yes gene_type:complete